MPSEPDPPSFVVLPEEYDEAFLADGEPGRARSRRLTGLARHRRARGAAAALACVVAGGFMAVAVTSERTAVRTAVPAAQAPAAVTPDAVAPGPWPRAPGACGSQRYLPIVTPTALRTRTGVRVQVGGQSVHTADLDAKSLTAAPGLQLSSGRFVSQLVSGNGVSYALVQGCDATETSSVLRISPDSSSLVLASDRHIESLLTDGRDGAVWAVQVADIATDEPITLVQLPGPGVVRLPTGLNPVAVWGNQLIGLAVTAGERRSPSSGTLVSYDLTARRMGPRIGQASSLTAGAGALLWIDQPCSLLATCALHSYDLATGARRVRDYPLPVETSITDGVISPDGAQLAFALERVYEGQRVDADGFGPPSDVAVLHVDTGVLERVGGLKLPATEKAGLTFSSRGDWLVIALNRRHGAELLVWRQGQPRPLRSGVRITDQMLGAPPVLALSP